MLFHSELGTKWAVEREAIRAFCPDPASKSMEGATLLFLHNDERIKVRESMQEVAEQLANIQTSKREK